MSESDIIVQNLTQDECAEIQNIVESIDGVNSCELIDFSSQEKNFHHKPISDEELDCLVVSSQEEHLYKIVDFILGSFLNVEG